MSEVHTGGCTCGAIRYRAEGKPMFGTVCHCTFCQRRLASAFAVLVTFPEEAVAIEQGEPQQREYRSDESGRWLRMSFCRDCGTTLCHRAEVRPSACTIAGGTFDDPNWFTITRHIWVRSKLPWVSIPPGVEAFECGFTRPPEPAR